MPPTREAPDPDSPGLDTKLTQLFKDGHRVRQRRLMYSPEFSGSLFYAARLHVIESEVPKGA